jgi:hypothetical protein
MSKKFKMKLVIDEVTTPLLYARLSAVDSARKRATILRLLAESALHGAGAPDTHMMSTHELSHEPRLHAGSHPLSDLIAAPTAVRERNGVAGEQPANEAVADGVAHDVDLIADEFAAFFG